MNNSYYKTSEITGKKYDVFKSIKILNIPQVIFYLQNNVPLQDIEISEDKNTKRPVLVFRFLREDTKEAFDAWCINKQN